MNLYKIKRRLKNGSWSFTDSVYQSYKRAFAALISSLDSPSAMNLDLYSVSKDGKRTLIKTRKEKRMEWMQQCEDRIKKDYQIVEFSENN